MTSSSGTHCCFILFQARTNTPVQQCLCDLVTASKIGRVLEETEYEGYEEAAVMRYLHDFVHMVHKPTVPGEEQVGYHKNKQTAFSNLLRNPDPVLS